MPEEPGRLHKPAVALIGDAKPILQRLLEVLPAHNAKRASRTCRNGRPPGRMAKAARDAIGPQIAFLDAIRAELPEDGILVDEVTQMGFAARLALPGLQAAHVPFARLPGQSRLGLCHRARRAGRPPRRAGGVDLRRRRLHVHRERDGDRGPPPHPARRPSCSTTAPSATSAASRRRSSATG